MGIGVVARTALVGFVKMTAATEATGSRSNHPSKIQAHTRESRSEDPQVFTPHDAPSITDHDLSRPTRKPPTRLCQSFDGSEVPAPA